MNELSIGTGLLTALAFNYYTAGKLRGVPLVLGFAGSFVGGYVVGGIAGRKFGF